MSKHPVAPKKYKEWEVDTKEKKYDPVASRTRLRQKASQQNAVTSTSFNSSSSTAVPSDSWSSATVTQGNQSGKSAPRRAPKWLYGLRHPDYAFEKEPYGQTASDTSRSSTEVRNILYTHPYTWRLILVGEILSWSTMQVDLFYKWDAYFRSGVPMYLIHDRFKLRLIVGSLNRLGDGKLSLSGDEEKEPEPGQTCYYRLVF